MDEGRRREEFRPATLGDTVDVVDNLQRLEVLGKRKERRDLRLEQLGLRIVLSTDVY